ncbi:MAG: hypothetical protein AB7E21_03535 [Pseudodonghicola sp.]
MPHLRYAALQETLARLLRYAMAEGLYSAAHHLNAALSRLRETEGRLSVTATRMQATTARLALEECHTILIDLGEPLAAADVAQAMAHLSDSHGDTPITALFPDGTEG